MNLDKGKKIYIIVSALSLLILLHPNSLLIIKTPLNELFTNKFVFVRYIPDVLSIVVLIIGYILLKVFYNNRSKYIKRYPIFILSIFSLWTCIIQIFG